MCGIAGIVDLRRLRPVPSHALLRMARSLRHRGPDEEGFFLEQGIGLACRRLSIVGLAARLQRDRLGRGCLQQ
jgi:asparagine synthase (glutamine-hydrolysing)